MKKTSSHLHLVFNVYLMFFCKENPPLSIFADPVGLPAVSCLSKAKACTNDDVLVPNWGGSDSPGGSYPVSFITLRVTFGIFRVCGVIDCSGSFKGRKEKGTSMIEKNNTYRHTPIQPSIPLSVPGQSRKSHCRISS